MKGHQNMYVNKGNVRNDFNRHHSLNDAFRHSFEIFNNFASKNGDTSGNQIIKSFFYSI